MSVELLAILEMVTVMIVITMRNVNLMEEIVVTMMGLGGMIIVKFVIASESVKGLNNIWAMDSVMMRTTMKIAIGMKGIVVKIILLVGMTIAKFVNVRILRRFVAVQNMPMTIIVTMITIMKVVIGIMALAVIMIHLAGTHIVRYVIAWIPGLVDYQNMPMTTIVMMKTIMRDAIGTMELVAIMILLTGTSFVTYVTAWIQMLQSHVDCQNMPMTIFVMMRTTMKAAIGTMELVVTMNLPIGTPIVRFVHVWIQMPPAPLHVVLHSMPMIHSVMTITIMKGVIGTMVRAATTLTGKAIALNVNAWTHKLLADFPNLPMIFIVTMRIIMKVATGMEEHVATIQTREGIFTAEIVNAWTLLLLVGAFPMQMISTVMTRTITRDAAMMVVHVAITTMRLVTHTVPIVRV